MPTMSNITFAKITTKTKQEPTYKYIYLMRIQGPDDELIMRTIAMRIAGELVLKQLPGFKYPVAFLKVLSEDVKDSIHGF